MQIQMILLTVLIGLCLAQNNMTTVAVIDFEAQGISDVEATILANRFRSELVNTNTFRVIERGQMESVLQEVGFQQTGCTSSDCMIEIGKILNVNKMIGGSIGKLGNVYTVDLRMIDVESSQILETVAEDHAGEMSDLLQVMKTIAYRFASREIEKQERPRGVGKIEISSQPDGATVFLDGKEVGETPYSLENIKTGDHTVKIVKKGYSDYETKVSVLENRTSTINPILVVLYELYIVSEPEGAAVFINNQSYGKTPFNKKLPKGVYEIKITKTNFKDYVKRINLNKSGKVTAKMELTDEYLARIRASQQNLQKCVFIQGH